MMLSGSNPKYSVGDLVTIERVFTRDLKLNPSTGLKENYDYSYGKIFASVVKVQKGYGMHSYQLKSIDGINLGGVLYWEKEITSLVASVSKLEDSFWETWGDR